MGTNTVARVMNDAGLAAWFGGSLMGAVAVDGTPFGRRTWARWAPVGAAAVTAHLVGGTLLVPINKGRLTFQRGVFPTSAAQTVCTLGGLAATIAAARTRARLEQADDGEDEALARRARLLDAAVPLLTGASLVLNSRLGELQRPVPVAGGVARRLLPWR
ncbi:MAG TPA: hypothetical protein VGB14_14615 [Acidimicrobiales bacterium]|jgi:hypothetical protein